MDSLHSIMDKRKKGTHLSLEERVIIQTRLKDHCSLRSIAREIGCSPSTIHYEVKRGTVSLYHGISPYSIIVSPCGLIGLRFRKIRLIVMLLTNGNVWSSRPV